MRLTALAFLTATAHALTPNRNIKVARKNTLDSSVTFDEYQNIMVRSRRPVVRRLHTVDATRVHLTMTWVVFFSSLSAFRDRVVSAQVRGMVPDFEGVKKLVPIPPTQETVNTLFPDANINSEDDMLRWYEGQRVKPSSGEAKNGEEAALSRVGPLLYERIFKHYTKKQWDKYPSELDASVLMRLPCRTSTDDRYFGDAWQALPVRGYTRIFENMLLRDPKISIKLNVDFFAAREAGLLPAHGKLVFTGPIDAYFAAQGLPKLEYRSLRFEEEFIEEPEDGFYQPAFVVNHPSSDVPFTRIVEYKHVPNQPTNVKQGQVKGTRIAKEYSSAEGDPYYPVPNPENRALYERYRALAEKESDVCFVGRLASYKYFNMDQAILNALEMFDSLKESGKLQPKRRPEDFGPGDGPK